MSGHTLQGLLQLMPQWAQHVHTGSYKALHDIQRCRTTALGYHLYQCSQSTCARQQMQYHSCRNRHCPACGASRQQQWVEARIRELIPCKYYHIVFTLPHSLNATVMGHRKILFDMLFQAAHYTLHTFGNDPKYLGGTVGIISVLHTWGQNLSFHPHVHCIVSGGGLDKQGQWQVGKKVKYGALFPVQAMEAVYRGRFVHLLQKALHSQKVNLPEGHTWAGLKSELFARRWVVYAKQPFGGPQQVIEYLGRYTHKIAISNHRIKNIDTANNVTFQYKDYADGNKKKLMTLSGVEFLRRFEQHLLPPRYCKIRSSGLYANHGRSTRISHILRQMNVPPHPQPVSTPWPIRYMAHSGHDPLLCPHCKQGRLVLVQIVHPKPWKTQQLKPPEP